MIRPLEASEHCGLAQMHWASMIKVPLEQRAKGRVQLRVHMEASPRPYDFLGHQYVLVLLVS